MPKNKKYIFYDIECANCHNNMAKISSFGYVITDEHFNVLSEKEIRINPDAKFFSHIKVDGKEVREEYVPEDIDTYLTSPLYGDAYNEISALFKMTNAIYIGFGNLSDAYYLFEANKRYNKPNFNYTFIDVKDVFTWRYRKQRCFGLQAMAKFFSIPWEQKHNSLDDAAMTSKVTRMLMRKIKNMDLQQMADISSAVYKVKNGQVFHDGKLAPKHIYPDMLIQD